MKSHFGNVIRKDGLVYGKPRKACKSKRGMRIPVLQREKVAFIKHRRLGYTISIISKVFGRSSNTVHKYIRNAYKYGTLRHLDLRKIPSKQRQISKAQRWQMIMNWLPHWEKWILGEGDKPP